MSNTLRAPSCFSQELAKIAIYQVPLYAPSKKFSTKEKKKLHLTLWGSTVCAKEFLVFSFQLIISLLRYGLSLKFFFEEYRER